MEMVAEKMLCTRCKYGVCMHKKHYTYDNRIINLYEWECTQKTNKANAPKSIFECVKWEEPASS